MFFASSLAILSIHIHKQYDRYASLSKGNIKTLLHALVAVYLLNIYFKNDSWLTNYQNISKMYMSCGSKIFAVNPLEALSNLKNFVGL